MKLNITGHRAVLSTSQVRKIRELYRKGHTQMVLAARFGVSQPTIHNLLAGRTYRTVV